MAVQTQIQVRRGTASSWTSTNPTLAAGEWGLETDTGKYKVGDGSSVWTGLGYASILPSTVTTKGDLLAATGSGAVSRLAVGSNGYTLVADSSTSTGLAYSPTFFAGKNKIINGDFNINQRAFTSTTSSNVYTFDRWKNYASDGTVTCSAETFTPGTAPVTGYESANYFRIVTTGQTAASAGANIGQYIEDVRTFANQTITISFWAKANSGTPKIAAELRQNFGSGGSPSSAVGTYAGQATLSTSWARYSITVAVPSISGKTIGTTANTSNLLLLLWVSAGTDLNSRTGSLGIQSNTFDIWGVQLEAGSTATQFQTATGTIQGELAACQRYYYRPTTGLYTQYGVGFGASTTQVDIFVQHPVTMRVAPSFSQSATKVFDGNGFITPSSVTTTDATTYSTNIRNTVTGATQFRPYKQSNDNNANAYIELSAEL